MTLTSKTFTLAEIAHYLNKLQAVGRLPLTEPVVIDGDADKTVDGIATLAEATSDHLGFLSNSKYRNQLGQTQAGAMILTSADRDGFAGPALVASDPYMVFAALTYLFDPTQVPVPSIHPTAIISPTATVAEGASVGPYVVIEDRVQIGSGTIIGPSVHVSHDVVIGEGCWIESQVTIHHHCQIGQRVRIHAGTVIGAEGFGFAPAGGRWNRIVQLGRVVIHDDVRIGANVTIDRGALDDTVIGRGVIIDNQVQIAHNVTIGEHTAIAAMTGIAGSTKIGAHCIFGGAVGISGHLDITDHVQLTGMTMVTSSIKEPGTYSSGGSYEKTMDWRRTVVRVRNLGKMSEQIKELQLALERLELQIHQQS